MFSPLDSEKIRSILECPDSQNKESYTDMVNMDCLNEAELLQNLSKRYGEILVYTYIGKCFL